MANRTTTQLQALQNQTPIDWNTESTATQLPSPPPQYPQTFIGATPKGTPYKSYDLARKRFEEERERQKRDEITANLYGGIFDVMDPLGAVGADVGKKLAKQLGAGETGQTFGEILGDVATGVGPADIGRIGKALIPPGIIGAPAAKKAFREQVITPLTEKLPPYSEGREALAQALKGKLAVTTPEEIFTSGAKPTSVGGILRPGRPDEDFFTQQQLTPKAPRWEHGVARSQPESIRERLVSHEGWHLLKKGLPRDTVRRLERATETGELPIHKELQETMKLYKKLYKERHKGKDLPIDILTDENMAFHMQDFLGYEEQSPKVQRFIERVLGKRSQWAAPQPGSFEDLFSFEDISEVAKTQRQLQLNALQR